MDDTENTFTANLEFKNARDDYYGRKDIMNARYSATNEIRAILDQILIKKKEIAAHENDILQRATAAINLPSNFEVKSLKHYDGDSYVVEIIGKNIYTEKEVEKSQDPDPDQAYINLGNRGDFKTILSSNILTKAEKRKALGLPTETTNPETE